MVLKQGWIFRTSEHFKLEKRTFSQPFGRSDLKNFQPIFSVSQRKLSTNPEKERLKQDIYKGPFWELKQLQTKKQAWDSKILLQDQRFLFPSRNFVDLFTKKQISTNEIFQRQNATLVIITQKRVVIKAFVDEWIKLGKEIQNREEFKNKFQFIEVLISQDRIYKFFKWIFERVLKNEKPSYSVYLYSPSKPDMEISSKLEFVNSFACYCYLVDKNGTVHWKASSLPNENAKEQVLNALKELM